MGARVLPVWPHPLSGAFVAGLGSVGVGVSPLWMQFVFLARECGRKKPRPELGQWGPGLFTPGGVLPE